jgi:hypothetical protein
MRRLWSMARVTRLRKASPQQSAAGNANARPELENSQDAKRTRTFQDFCGEEEHRKTLQKNSSGALSHQ